MIVFTFPNTIKIKLKHKYFSKSENLNTILSLRRLVITKTLHRGAFESNPELTKAFYDCIEEEAGRQLYIDKAKELKILPPDLTKDHENLFIKSLVEIHRAGRMDLSKSLQEQPALVQEVRYCVSSVWRDYQKSLARSSHPLQLNVGIISTADVTTREDPTIPFIYAPDNPSGIKIRSSKKAAGARLGKKKEKTSFFQQSLRFVDRADLLATTAQNLLAKIEVDHWGINLVSKILKGIKIIGHRDTKAPKDYTEESLAPKLEEKRNFANGLSKLLSGFFSVIAVNQLIVILYKTVAFTGLDQLVAVPLFTFLKAINRVFTPEGVAVYNPVFGFFIENGVISFSIGQGVGVFLGAIINLVVIWYFCYFLIFLFSRLIEPLYSREDYRLIKKAKEQIKNIEAQKRVKSLSQHNDYVKSEHQTQLQPKNNKNTQWLP